MGRKTRIAAALILGFGCTAQAGNSPKPFRDLVGGYAGTGKQTEANFFQSISGDLTGRAEVAAAESPASAGVVITSTLARGSIGDRVVTWLYVFGRKGVLDLRVTLANGATGTMRGTYSTKDGRVVYGGTVNFNNGQSGRNRGSFRLRRTKFVVRDKVVLFSSTIRSKQVMRAED